MTALDAHLSGAQRELLGLAASLAERELAPLAASGTPGEVTRPLLRAMAEHGLLDRLFSDVGAMDLCLIREGLARHCTEAETAFAVQGLGSYPILQNEALAAHWRPRLAAGDAVAAFALTEPDAGTDVAAHSLRAEPDGDGYRLSGEKT